jgi:phosphoribosylformylglycinamidine (FGAM) synthase PurS component
VLHVVAPDAKAADAQVREMCGKLLANPVTEDFEIATVESA